MPARPAAPFWPDGPLAGPGGLILRPLGEGDVEAMVAATNHSSVTSAISFLSDPFGPEDARALLARHASGHDVWFGAFPDGRLAGVVGCHESDGEVEIGYWFSPGNRGRGLARASAALVVDWARQVRPGRPLIAECRPDNAASWKLLTTIGFAPTGEPGRRDGRLRLVFSSS
ncbi:MAG: GNAT family N-acetyltransferase [Alsobacter sp.]